MFLGPTRVYNPSDNSIVSAITLQLTVLSPYTLLRGGTCPPKLPLNLGGLGPSPNAWFLGFTRVHNTNSISIGSSVDAGLTFVSNRHTDRQDRPRYIRSNRPHLTLCIAMRPNNNHHHHFTAIVQVNLHS